MILLQRSLYRMGEVPGYQTKERGKLQARRATLKAKTEETWMTTMRTANQVAEGATLRKYSGWERCAGLIRAHFRRSSHQRPPSPWAAPTPTISSSTSSKARNVKRLVVVPSCTCDLANAEKELRPLHTTQKLSISLVQVSPGKMCRLFSQSLNATKFFSSIRKHGVPRVGFFC